MEAVEPFLGEIDSLLVMTVNPGFGGQHFITETLPKSSRLRPGRRERGLNFHIGVDGGIDFETVAQCARAAPTLSISGTGLFSRPNLKTAVAKMRNWPKPPRRKNSITLRMSNIKFGTDGWRAVIAATSPFTISTGGAGGGGLLERHAHSWHGKKNHRRLRPPFSLRSFRAPRAEIMAGNGFEVVLSNCPTPTPAVSYAVKKQKAAGGVMITASHNPAIFNGFKNQGVLRWFGRGNTLPGRGKRIDQTPVRALARTRPSAPANSACAPPSRSSRRSKIC